MADKRILTFAALGAALVLLISKANELPEIKQDLENFKADFDELSLQSAAGSETNADVTEMNEVIADLKAQLEAALEEKAKKTDKHTIKIDGVTYLINHGSHPYSAVQISQDEKIAKDILKIGGQVTLTPVK